MSHHRTAFATFRNGGPTPEQTEEARRQIINRGTRALTDQINQQIAKAFGPAKKEKAA